MRLDAKKVAGLPILLRYKLHFYNPFVDLIDDPIEFDIQLEKNKQIREMIKAYDENLEPEDFFIYEEEFQFA